MKNSDLKPHQLHNHRSSSNLGKTFKQELEARVLVTGGVGMVGRSLVSRLRDLGYKNILALSRSDADLEDRKQTAKVFTDFQPEYVFHLASKVGGIRANMSDPVGFLQANLLINTHVLIEAFQHKVRKFLFLGSSCIYPRECPQPMREEYLLTGPLEPTNEGYALSKISGLKLAEYYNRQYNMNVICPMPCNIYGPGDTFDLEHSHVMSALVRRFVEATRKNSESITLWGTGKARREFIFVQDVVDCLIYMMDKVDNHPQIINVGTGYDYSIAELAEMIAQITNFKGKILWDTSKPDGMPRKCLDVSKLKSLGFTAETKITDGIEQVIQDFKNKFPQ